MKSHSEITEVTLNLDNVEMRNFLMNNLAKRTSLRLKKISIPIKNFFQ